MFRFAHPEVLYLLVLIPLLVLFFVIMYRRKKKAMEEFGDSYLMKSLMPLVSYGRNVWKFTLILVAIFFLIIGAAGPQFGSKLQQIKREGVELMVVLDVSNSMLAQDIKPNRLEKAKMAISRMVEKLSNDKLGMVVFAGDAYVQLPITTDYSSARMFLSGINTDLIPVQGTSIGAAIDLAAESFTPNSEASKAIIVITDGENHEDDAQGAARRAKEKGITVHTIGMGLEQGAPIPSKEIVGEFLKDNQGKVVVSKLNESMLQKIAQAGEGVYVRASNSSVGLSELLQQINKMEKSTLEERVYTDYAERYQYFLIVGVLLLLIEFLVLGRRNKNLMKMTIFDVKKNNQENKLQ